MMFFSIKQYIKCLSKNTFYPTKWNFRFFFLKLQHKLMQFNNKIQHNKANRKLGYISYHSITQWKG